MKTTLFIFAVILLASCGVKVPYTNEIRDEFALDNEKAVKKVQFYTSATVIFERSKSSGNQGTSESGVLVTNSSKEQDRIIIPINTKCIFDSYGEDGELIIRFETGVNKTLTFMMRPNVQNSKFYLVADWTNPKGGKIYNYSLFWKYVFKCGIEKIAKNETKRPNCKRNESLEFNRLKN